VNDERASVSQRAGYRCVKIDELALNNFDTGGEETVVANLRKATRRKVPGPSDFGHALLRAIRSDFARRRQAALGRDRSVIGNAVNDQVVLDSADAAAAGDLDAGHRVGGRGSSAIQFQGSHAGDRRDRLWTNRAGRNPATLDRKSRTFPDLLTFPISCQ
jgi:hypothetical protein